MVKREKDLGEAIRKEDDSRGEGVLQSVYHEPPRPLHMAALCEILEDICIPLLLPTSQDHLTLRMGFHLGFFSPNKMYIWLLA